MRKSTKMVGFLAVAGVLLFATAGFAGNVTSYNNHGSTTMNNGRWMNNQPTQGGSTHDTCPWYKRWFGIHNDNCRWDNSNNSSNTNNNSGCCR